MSSRLHSLPPELRVCIYEFVFGDNSADEVELFAASQNQPSTALLATCYEIYNEAQPFYAAASRLYRNKTFTIMLDNSRTTSSDLLDTLKRFEMLGPPPAVRSLRFTWLGCTTFVHFKAEEKLCETTGWDAGRGRIHYAIKDRYRHGEFPGEQAQSSVFSLHDKTLLDTWTLMFCIMWCTLDAEDAAGRDALKAHLAADHRFEDWNMFLCNLY